MIGIYIIKNTINNKVYIGQSNNIERIFTGVYYKKEIEQLKTLYPKLFQSEGSTTIS